MNTEQIISILYKRLAGGHISADELASLDAWIAENPEKRRRMVEQLSDPAHLTEEYRLRALTDHSRQMKDMENRLGLSQSSDSGHPRFRWKWPLAAAASVALIFGSFFIFRSWNTSTQTPSLAMTSDVKSPLRIENLGPGSSRAVVTTHSGDTIHLAGKENITALAESGAQEPLQIDVPRGGEFVVTLEDSTRVWLNSESRLIYPSRFDSGSRLVKLEGEAYFDVTHNPEAPFIVESYGQQVKVYGTEFNVRAYPEEAMVYTTLSSGSISLSPAAGGGEVFLSPGKQAMFDKETLKAQIRNVDLERVTGWRHGRFVFEEQSLRQIMRDLARWYDFSYRFADEDAAETIFMGSIPRYSNFKTAIAILEKSGGLNFSVSDDVIIISSKQ